MPAHRSLALCPICLLTSPLSVLIFCVGSCVPQAGVRSLKVELSDAQADALFARFDSDGDDEISYSEWVRLLAAK